MPNVNRQTIYQMGNVVNDVVKQATGRDPVQAISMDYVTVEQNKLLGIETHSGAEVTFVTLRSVPLLSLVADITAKQDLHGYDYPWPGGGGKNLGNFIDGYGIGDDGSISESSSRCATVDPIIIDQSISYVVSGVEGTAFIYSVWNNDTLVRRVSDVASGTVLNVSDGTSLYVCAYKANEDATVAQNKPQVELGTTPTTYAPYSNICPITGYTGCNTSISCGDLPTLVYPDDWEASAGTVYGGTVDVLNGVLTKTYMTTILGNRTWTMEESDGKRIFSANAVSDKALDYDFICNCYKAVSKYRSQLENMEIGTYNATSGRNRYSIRDDRFTSASDFKTYLQSIGAIAVAHMASSVVYELTSREINTRVGENVVSASTGDVSLSYYVYHDLL